MKYCTLTEKQAGRSGQLDFLEQQRQHPCTDCGHSYLSVPTISDGQNFSREIIGGGTVVSSNHGPITEVHILPHCGTELPPDFLEELDPDQLPVLSELVHENADIGTGAIYRTLVEDVVSGKAKGIVVAGFHLSRILLDANRAKLEEQMPLRPYVGSTDVYSQYLNRRRAQLREEALLPWLDAVDKILRGVRDGVVYHHHTYDVTSLSPRPWDRGSDRKRPAFQLVWKKPTWKEQGFDHGEPVLEYGLAPREEIESVRSQISSFLQEKIGLADSGGAIDFPLRLPLVPFLGACSEDPPGAPRHVVYDLRKDVLMTEDQIQSWVTGAPWRITVTEDRAAGHVFGPTRR